MRQYRSWKSAADLIEKFANQRHLITEGSDPAPQALIAGVGHKVTAFGRALCINVPLTGHHAPLLQHVEMAIQTGQVQPGFGILQVTADDLTDFIAVGLDFI